MFCDNNIVYAHCIAVACKTFFFFFGRGPAVYVYTATANLMIDRYARRRRIRRLFHGGRNIRNHVFPEGLRHRVLELRRFRHRGRKSLPIVFFFFPQTGD